MDKDVEIPADIVRKHIEKKESIAKGKPKPLTIEEVWELRRQKLAEKAMEKLVSDDDEKKDDDDISLDKILKYQMLGELIGSRNKSDDPMVAELKRQNDMLARQIEDMKRQQEEERRRREMDELRNNMLAEIRALKDQLSRADAPKDKDVINERIGELESMLFKKQEDEKHQQVMDRLESLHDAYNDLKAEYDRLRFSKKSGSGIDDLLEQMDELERKKRKFAKLLGLTQEQTEKTSVADMVEQFAEVAPKAAEAVSSIRDAFSTREIEDDVPQPEPNYNMPIRDQPVNEQVSIDPEIEKFLAKCTEVKNENSPDGMQLIDPEGIPWTTTDGRPLSKAAIRDLAVIAPEAVLQRIREVKPKKAEWTRKKPEKPRDETTKETPEEPAEEQIEPEAPASEEPGGEPDGKEDNAEKEHKSKEDMIASYIDSLQLKKLPDGTESLVGADGEYYTLDGKPVVDRDELRREAASDPDSFLDVMANAIKRAREGAADGGS